MRQERAVEFQRPLDSARIFKDVLFYFFLLEDSMHVFPVCRGLDLLSQFPCWWAHLFLLEKQAAGHIFYLFQHLCKPCFRKISCGAGAGWGVNVMNGISYPHVQASIQVCFICMEVEGYKQQLECCFLFIIHLVKSLFCLSYNHICSSYLHMLWMCLQRFSSWCKFWVTALSLGDLLFSYNSLTSGQYKSEMNQEQCSGSSWAPRDRGWSHCLSCVIGLELPYFTPQNSLTLLPLAQGCSMPQEGKRRRDILWKNTATLPSIKLWVFTHLSYVSFKLSTASYIKGEAMPCILHTWVQKWQIFLGSSQQQQTATRGKWMSDCFIVGMCNAIIVAWDRSIWCCAGH